MRGRLAMITAIDRSPDWRRPRLVTLYWARHLEALFLHFPDRRPASSLEVLLLSAALDCPEVVIERHRVPGVGRIFQVDSIPPALHAHNAGLYCVPDKIGNAMRAQLGHHPAAMKLHGLHRNV